MSLTSFKSGDSLEELDLQEKPVDILPPGTVVGRYVILHLLGHGAAGLVYAAYDGELDRKLALKFLRLRGDTEAVREASHRLRREAQAMARLSHPNVVSIHDVGRASGHMFLIMDFVPGGTLKQWLATPRPWRERLELLCKAGDGLAAAHTAGVVHRDFKPSNVLVDGDQPRVTDFGIAAASRSDLSSMRPPPQTVATPTLSADAPGDETLETRGILGTVGYLAPEQAYLSAVDARSDQFSFCVTLYQALWGSLPFPSDTLLAYVDAITRGTVLPVPPEPRVPRSVHAAILRGLKPNAADRFPSMQELLAELRRDRGREARRRWTFWGALFACVVVLGVVARTRGERAPICPRPDEELGGAWTPALRDRIGALFTVTTPFGAKTFVPLSETISRYAGAVAQMRTEACESARVHGTQSDTVMTLRLQCLDERARELRSFVQLLTSADEKVVGGAAESLSKLSAVTECADVAALTAPIPPPTPAIAASVEAMRGELAEARALASVGRHREATDRASALAALAEPLGYAPLLAEIRYAQGTALSEQGKHDLAEKTLRAAIDTADEGKDDLLRGQAYIQLSMVVGRRMGHYEAAIVAGTSALHIARRLGSPTLEADALERLGMDHAQTGLIEQGLRESTEALAIKERLEGPDDLGCAGTHVAMSVALSELGRFDETLREDRRAIEIAERALGPTHPSIGIYKGNMATDLVWAGRAEEALPLADEAIRIIRDAFGTAHPDYATVLNDRSYALTKLGRFAEAAPLNEEAIAISERAEGDESASVAYPLVGLGEDLLGLGRAAEALPMLERSTRIAETNALDPETLGECHYHLARAVWLVTHDAKRAAALARRAAADYGRSPRLAPRGDVARGFAEEREAAHPPSPAPRQ